MRDRSVGIFSMVCCGVVDGRESQLKALRAKTGREFPQLPEGWLVSIKATDFFFPTAIRGWLMNYNSLFSSLTCTPSTPDIMSSQSEQQPQSTNPDDHPNAWGKVERKFTR
jgi:hypothetical protein